MLSKKMAVSLTSLIIMLAFAFAVPSAMAHPAPKDHPVAHIKVPPRFFSVKVPDRDVFANRSVIHGFDVKVRQDPEVAQYALTSGGALETNPININLDVEFRHPVGVLDVNNDGTDDQVTFRAFDSVGGEVTAPGVVMTDLPFGTAANQYHRRTASRRRIQVVLTPATQTTPTANADRGEVNRIVVSFIKIATIDPTVTITPTNIIDMSASGTVDITVHQSTTQEGSTAGTADFDTPRVVSIQRLRPGSQTVVAAFQEAAVTGDFDVRIVLTEAGVDWKPDKVNDRINVAGGTPVSFVAGTPFPREGAAVADVFAPTRAQLLHTTKPHPREGMYEHDGLTTLLNVPAGVLGSGPVPYPTGTDLMYHQYRVTIKPHRRAERVIITIKAFHDGDTPYNNYYQPGVNAASTPNGREKLDLPVDLEQFEYQDGRAVFLPHVQKAKITYANDTAGHYILTRSKVGSHIKFFNHEDTPTPLRENKPKEQTRAELLYNVRATGLPNLETFLANDGTIHLVSYVRDGDDPKYKKGDAYISEVMWGTDASQDPVSNSNWIEIRNGTGEAIAIEDGGTPTDKPAIDGAGFWQLWFYEAHETPAPEYPADSIYEGPQGVPGEIIDIIGTKASNTGLSWSIVSKGQNGRSNIDIARTTAQVLVPTTALISMYRVMNVDGTLSDGTQASSWMQSTSPSVNFGVGRENAIVATPGAAPFDTPDTDKEAADKEAAAEKAKADAAKAAADKLASTGTYPMAGDGRVYISEVMFAGGGTLPQWIEIANGDRAKEFNLSGWTLTVDNAVADADVSVGSAEFTIPDGTMIAPSAQNDDPSTILVVTERGRNSFAGAKASGQVINLSVDNEIELILAGVVTGKYTLLSNMAFLITLAPPAPADTKAPAGETKAEKATRQATEKREAAMRKAATDMAGNLGTDGAAAWALPMNEEGGRSSIIRRHVQVTRGPKAPEEEGMMMDSWILASDTSFADVTHIRARSYYGAANDVGTPGFRAGGALPVELSHFRPARDKATGAVVITWSTQSELNNAGFFIKRSNQPDSEFKVINATMIAGAGTTSEKQFYTYTDTTAQPNVVYYYQIEDVSLDGNHQTLTRGIRLKGHVSVAGKATLTWGELKTSHE